MKRTSMYIVVVVLVVLGVVFFAKCNNSNPHTTTTSTDSTSPMGPAPDNNSANNPSLADTAYEKDRTRPITDTMKKK
jgi:hypothetical protein